MTEVVIRNKNILDKLNSFVDELFSIEGYNDPYYRMHDGELALTNPEYYCSEEWLQHKLDNWQAHSGYPEEHYSQPMTNMASASKEKFEALKNKIRTDFTTEIGAMHAALTNYYPPGGFVGWHTNWNANCYQILFTWSKSGDGYFKYYDKQKDEIVTIQDKPGWQCRHYYFGRKDEPDHHCWHAAYTNDERVTLAYKFTNNSINDTMDVTARMMRDQLIEDIESEE